MLSRPHFDTPSQNHVRSVVILVYVFLRRVKVAYTFYLIGLNNSIPIMRAKVVLDARSFTRVIYILGLESKGV